MERKKILILAPFYPPNIGGAETFAYNLAKELAKKHAISVLAFQPLAAKKAPYYECCDDGIEVCRLDWPFNPGKTWQGTGIKNFLLVFPKMLYWAILWQKRRQFDIVLANGLISCAVASILRFKGILKKIGIMHAYYGFKGRNRQTKAFARLFLVGIDKIFVEGQIVKDDILTLGIPEDKIGMYMHWCDQKKFSVVKREKRKKLCVLCAGRLDYTEKGAGIIQEVERQLQGKEIEFVYLKDVPHQDMPKYYQMADVVVIPSVYAESYPIVAIEAASCGCVLIVSDKGCLPHLVKSFGLVAEEKYTYIESFKQQILKLYYDKGLLHKLQKKTYEYALENFSSKNAEVFLK